MLVFKGIPNSKDFYKVIFLHINPVYILVSFSVKNVLELLLSASHAIHTHLHYYAGLNSEPSPFTSLEFSQKKNSSKHFCRDSETLSHALPPRRRHFPTKNLNLQKYCVKEFFPLWGQT